MSMSRSSSSVRLVIRGPIHKRIAVLVLIPLMAGVLVLLAVQRFRGGPVPPRPFRIDAQIVGLFIIIVAFVLWNLDARLVHSHAVCRTCGYRQDEENVPETCSECGADLKRPDAVGTERPWRLKERRAIALIVGVPTGLAMLVQIIISLLH